MGLPNINITCHTLAKALAAHGGKGTLAVILKDTAAGEYTLYSAADIPASLSDANKTYLSRAFLGTVTGPEKPSRMRTGSVSLSMMRTWPFSAWPSTKPETPIKFATKVLAGRV